MVSSSLRRHLPCINTPCSGSTEWWCGFFRYGPSAAYHCPFTRPPVESLIITITPRPTFFYPLQVHLLTPHLWHVSSVVPAFLSSLRNARPRFLLTMTSYLHSLSCNYSSAERLPLALFNLDQLFLSITIGLSASHSHFFHLISRFR